MRLNYYRDTDSLYIDLSEKKSVDSVEISEGVVIDYDANGNIAGIDIDNASKKLSIKKLVVNKLPSEQEVLVA
ncbi:MAG: DUF2283 domain-containing protein [bacterium]